MKNLWITAGLVTALTVGMTLQAELVEERITYQHGDTELEGLLIYDNAVSGARPGVLVIHEWWGLNAFSESRARDLAGKGYVAFAADMYGKGKTTRDPKEAGTWAGHLRGSPLLRERALAGLSVLAERPEADASRLGAIGFCFGGTTVLELALSGAPLQGVVSFHGGLAGVSPAQSGETLPRILICHGASDSFISAEEIMAFQAVLNEAGVDWQMVYYGGALHSFTNPEADQSGVPGVAYNANAARRSEKHMLYFFKELFA